MSHALLMSKTETYFRDLLDHLFKHGGDVKQAASEALVAADTAGITEYDARRIFAYKWQELVDQALDDHILTTEEESRLNSIIEAFSIPQYLLDEKGHLSKLVKAAVLRDLQAGTPKTRVTLDIPLPFKLQAKEVLLWVFPKVRLFERITKREITGRSTGASFRVMKGVYWRVGAFKGVPVSWEETHHTDTGLLALTSKHIIFSGPVRNQRVAYSKLASIEPYADAIEIQRDAVTAKPQIFRDIDGQFAYNVIQFA